MNENAQNNGVLSSALEIAAVGAAGYGIHKGMMSETASKFANANAGAGGIKGLASGAIMDYRDAAETISKRWKGNKRPIQNVSTPLDSLMHTTNSANANSILNKSGVDNIKNAINEKPGPTLEKARKTYGPTVEKGAAMDQQTRTTNAARTNLDDFNNINNYKKTGTVNTSSALDAGPTVGNARKGAYPLDPPDFAPTTKNARRGSYPKTTPKAKPKVKGSGAVDDIVKAITKMV